MHQMDCRDLSTRRELEVRVPEARPRTAERLLDLVCIPRPREALDSGGVAAESHDEGAGRLALLRQRIG
jgi:hypothetical protein